MTCSLPTAARHAAHLHTPLLKPLFGKVAQFLFLRLQQPGARVHQCDGLAGKGLHYLTSQLNADGATANDQHALGSLNLVRISLSTAGTIMLLYS